MYDKYEIVYFFFKNRSNDNIFIDIKIKFKNELNLKKKK